MVILFLEKNILIITFEGFYLLIYSNKHGV